MKFAWIQTEKGQLSAHETVSLAGRHAEWLLRLAAAPGIDARAGGPPPEGAGPGVHSPRASSGTAVPVFTRI